jgi:hypothetical protein
MEGNVLDVLRVLVLVLVWAIPAILVLLVAVFAILTPVFIWAGVVSGLFRVIRDRLRRRVAAPRRARRTVEAPVLREVT